MDEARDDVSLGATGDEGSKAYALLEVVLPPLHRASATNVLIIPRSMLRAQRFRSRARCYAYTHTPAQLAPCLH
eukprot:1965298-Pleurochrysis_carterae.AAC.1